MRAFLKSLLKLSYISVATASVLFGLTLAGALALTYAMGETSCRDDKYNNTRTYLCEGAAKLGHPLASFFVATDHHFETSKNKQAIGLFKRAATKGHEPSQFALGLIYYFGIGAEEDEPLGIHWINEAYEAGYNPAAEFVDDFNRASRNTDKKSG